MYKHFADKESLFTQIVTTTVNEISDPISEEILHLADSGDLEADLRDLARRLLARVMQLRLLELRRLVIAEAGRFQNSDARSMNEDRGERSPRWRPCSSNSPHAACYGWRIPAWRLLTSTG